MSLMKPKSTNKKWSVSSLVDAEGPWDVEFKARDEWHHFTVLMTEDRIVFGGVCNSGFLESGYMLRKDGLSRDEQMHELREQLQDYYNQGPEAAPALVCNQRM